MINVAVMGATGRMGKLALELIDASQDLRLHAALDSSSEISAITGADVVFDVTNLGASKSIVDYCIDTGARVLVGTSGWTTADHLHLAKRLESAPTGAAVVIVPNFSIGSMLASKFAAEAAKHFDSIEIIESHHEGKKDSPSGTAIYTAELISDSRRDLVQPLITGVGQQAQRGFSGCALLNRVGFARLHRVHLVWRLGPQRHARRCPSQGH